MRPANRRLRQKADAGDRETRGQGESADAETRRRGDAAKEQQLGLFAARDANLVREMAEMDLNAMTPIEAMNKLSELKKKAEGVV